MEIGCAMLLKKSNTTAEHDSRVDFPFYVLKNLTHANTHNKTYSKGYGETYIVVKLSKKGEEEQQQQQAKNGYWQNELYSLGISVPKLKKEEELNGNKEELENLADNIKEAMFEDYKLAYNEEGDAHKEEAESTVTVG